MDATVPYGAALLLDFIAGYESGGDYNILYGHHERGLPHPITSMTLNQLLTAQIGWGREWGSSAAGRYQMMQPTLAGLQKTLGLGGSEAFAPDLQDRLGYQLLKQRGYAGFMARQISLIQFAKNVAEEWASMPVLAATQGAHRPIVEGQSYYAGDGLNKALVSAPAFEGALTKALARAT